MSIFSFSLFFSFYFLFSFKKSVVIELGGNIMNVARLSKFRFLRKERGMNLEDIAKELHVSKAYISMIETGKRSLDYEMAIQMAGLFDVRPDDVFFEDIAKTLS